MRVAGLGEISSEGTVIVYDDEGALTEVAAPRLQPGYEIEQDADGNWHIITNDERIHQQDLFYYDTRSFLSYKHYLYVCERYQKPHDMFRRNPFFLADIMKDESPITYFPQIDKNIILDTFKKRISEIRYAAKFVLKRNEDAGNTWMPYDELNNKVLALITADGHPFLNGYDDIKPFLKTEDFYLGHGKAALYETYRREHIISHMVDMIKTMPPTMPLWNPEENRILTEEQSLAVKNIVLKGGRISILTGGPGTGKTTILKDIVYNIRNQYPDTKIFILSTTGKAARVINSVFGGLEDGISTVHKFLGFGHPMTSKDTDRIKSAGFVIVDESSMLDLEIFASLMSSLDFAKCKLVLVGDVDQLPSIGAGNVLSDLIERGVYTVRLNENHRSKRSIVNNARRVKEGIPVLENGDDFQIFDLPPEASMLVPAAIQNENSVIITPYRKRGLPGSCTEINEKVQDLMHRPHGFNVGDRVIISKTSYKGNYYNGEAGTIVSRTADGWNVNLYDRTVSLSNENDMELGYAMTVHKSQGSEYDVCDICIPEFSPFVTRRMLYTAITRAKERVRLWTNPKTIRQVIANNPDVERHTFLKE